MELQTKFNLNEFVWVIRWSIAGQKICPDCHGNKTHLKVGNVIYYCGKCNGTGRVYSTNPEQYYAVSGVVREINIRIIQESEKPIIKYGVELGEKATEMYEEDTFLLEKEAKQECDERNSKLKKENKSD